MWCLASKVETGGVTGLAAAGGGAGRGKYGESDSSDGGGGRGSSGVSDLCTTWGVGGSGRSGEIHLSELRTGTGRSGEDKAATNFVRAGTGGLGGAGAPDGGAGGLLAGTALLTVLAAAGTGGL